MRRGLYVYFRHIIRQWPCTTEHEQLTRSSCLFVRSGHHPTEHGIRLDRLRKRKGRHRQQSRRRQSRRTVPDHLDDRRLRAPEHFHRPRPRPGPVGIVVVGLRRHGRVADCVAGSLRRRAVSRVQRLFRRADLSGLAEPCLHGSGEWEIGRCVARRDGWAVCDDCMCVFHFVEAVSLDAGLLGR